MIKVTIIINAEQNEDVLAVIRKLAQDPRLREMREDSAQITTIDDRAIATISWSWEE